MFGKLRNVLKNTIEKISYTELRSDDIEKIENEIIFSLAEVDVAVEVAEFLVKKLKERIEGYKVKRGIDKKYIIKQFLRDILLELFEQAGCLDLLEKVKEKREGNNPLIILFVGPNGHGKTTTIAKVAKWFMKNGFSVVIAAADTYRAGAIEQLEIHAERIGVKVVKHDYGADPAAVAYDAVAYARKHKIDVVLIDTAGRLQSDINLMEEMKKIARVINPDLKIFVGDALTGNDALDQAIRFNEAIGIDGSILTKIDADVKGGAAISIIYATKKPIIFIGTGQGYDDLQIFDYKKFVSSLL
ncbi:MAG: signal recognition particle-docking protein FtsY [Thermoproteales archaeon]|nr:signal recognition particle-docking protein FtsY [Thermoproteales archaeon]